MAVSCPSCERRVFDIIQAGNAQIAIKCPICGRIATYALDSPEGRVIAIHPKRAEARKVIVTEQRALK